MKPLRISYIKRIDIIARAPEMIGMTIKRFNLIICMIFSLLNRLMGYFPRKMYYCSEIGTFFCQQVRKTHCTRQIKLTNLQWNSEIEASPPLQEGQKMYEIDYSRVRYVARVIYLGTAYQGWQVQPNQQTVQGTLHKVFKQRFDQSIYPVGASRTDAGVHANGQAIHFDIPADYNIGCLDLFESAVNRLLPPTIKIYNVSKAPPGNAEQRRTGEPFHATKSAEGKLYSYRFCTNRFVHPFDQHRYAHIYHPFCPIQLNLLEESLKIFVGTHNFTAFANKIDKKYEEFSSKEVEYSPIRTIRSITIHEEDPVKNYYRVDFLIESALYKMIRNIMGTAFQVSMKKMPIQEMQELLYQAKTRKENHAKGAVGHGLTLEHVFYDYY